MPSTSIRFQMNWISTWLLETTGVSKAVSEAFNRRYVAFWSPPLVLINSSQKHMAV